MIRSRRHFALAGLAIMLLLTYRLSAPQGHGNLDAAILGWFSRSRSDSLDQVMIILTWLGSLLVLGPLAAFIAWRLMRRGMRDQAWLLLGALSGVAILGRLAKWWIDRPRPDLHTWLSTLPMDTSYPSLHALQATAFFLALGLILRSRTFWPIAIGLTFVVALSRLYLQVHFPSDIAAGMIGAIFWTMAIYWTRDGTHAK